MVNLFTDGLQIALLWETRQQSLHTAVELLFTIKLERKEKEQKLKWERLGDKTHAKAYTKLTDLNSLVKKMWRLSTTRLTSCRFLHVC